MQNPSHQLFTEDVLDEVLLSMDGDEEENRPIAEKILSDLNLTPFTERHPMSLSGGQQQRVAVASAVASGREIMIFDEPTSGLDFRHMEEVAKAVSYTHLSEERLSEQIAFVLQTTRLFKTSILENVRMARPTATEDEVLSALHQAQCDDIIQKFPQGIHTTIGTEGVYLSGGEVQRLALARAVLKNAPIIILDEATSFADAENEYQIQKAFEHLMNGKTVLMIAHRLTRCV